MQETVEDPLDIETVAERCGISARDLQYLFQAAPENKPQKMYMALRLQHAKELWLYNAMSIRETGLASGLARRPPITGLSTQFIKQATRISQKSTVYGRNAY
jgi:AraC family carnitine catabolism transcriptional activator